MAINGREYGSSGPSMPRFTKETLTTPTKAVNLGKVFGVMFIWLIITAGISLGFGILFQHWLFIGNTKVVNQSAVGGLYAILISSGISLIIMTFIIQFFALRKGKGMIILSSIYVILMGVLCSSLVLFIDWWILGLALGITSVIFGVLTLIGMIARNIKPIAIMGLMLVIGAGITALITWLVILFTGVSGSTVMWLWIIDFAMFAGMLLLIIVDISQINRICASGEVTNNLVLYCALTLYTDFIYIFIKIAYYIAIMYGRSR